MRVLEVIRSMNIGGAQNLLVQRVKYASNLNIVTRVINTLPRQSALVVEASLKSIFKETSSNNPLLAHFEVLRQIREFKPDVVVVHSPTPAILLKLSRIAGLLREPLVEVVHSAKHPSKIVTAMSIFTNFGADLGLSVSNGVQLSPITLGFRKKVVSHQGIDQSQMLKWRQENPHGLPRARISSTSAQRNPLKLVFCGRLENPKRPLDAVRIMKHLRGEAVTLTMVGWGSLGPLVEQFVIANGLEQQVEIAGEVPSGWRYMADADLLLLTSEYEGLGLVIMEAFTFGLPVLVPDIGGVQDIVTDGRNGKLVSPGKLEEFAQEIRNFMVQRDELAQYSIAAKEDSKKWGVESSAKQFYLRLREQLKNGVQDER